MMKRLALSVAVVAAISFSSETLSSYNVRVPLHSKSVKLSSFDYKDTIYSEWKDSGGHYDCQAWSPERSSVDYGSTFIQSRSCKQNQTRTATPRNHDQFSGEDKVMSDQSYPEYRVIDETESQQTTGERREWSSFTSSFTEWEDIGEIKSLGSWTPSASNQINNFIQTRTHKQEQERFEQKREKDSVTGDIRNNGEPIRETRLDDRNENRTVSVTESSWSFYSDHSYGEWSPSPASVCSGESFTQTVSFIRREQKTYSFSIGGSHNVYRDLNDSQTRNATGSKTCENWVSASPSVGSWQNDGSGYGYGQFSPSETGRTSGFTQTRSYSQPQKRTVQNREYDTISGSYRDTDSYEETRVASLQDSRYVSVSLGSWQRVRDYNFGTWTPSTSSINYGQTFTQTRSFSTEYVRTVSYSTGTSWEQTNYITDRTESRTNTGTADYVTGSSWGAWSGWSNYGTATYTSGWSHLCRDNIGSMNIYTSKTYDQPQRRSRTLYRTWASGSSQAIDTEHDYRTYSGVQEWPNYDCSGHYDSNGNWTG